MTGETAREISTKPEVLKRIAKCLAQQCLRNAMLEDSRGSACRDYSGLTDRRLHRRGRPVALRGDSLANVSRLPDEETKG